tara:strand:- start:222 stop:521 length:300 start_codon:yes stop_codon:yes gene_type:complete
MEFYIGIRWPEAQIVGDIARGENKNKAARYLFGQEDAVHLCISPEDSVGILDPAFGMCLELVEILMTPGEIPIGGQFYCIKAEYPEHHLSGAGALEKGV